MPVLTPLQLCTFGGCQLAFPELNVEPLQRAGELGRHLRLVLIDDGRAGVHAAVKALIEGELAERIGLLEPTFADGLAINGERPLSPLAQPATVVDEVEDDRVLARREVVGPGNPGLVLPLL